MKPGQRTLAPHQPGESADPTSPNLESDDLRHEIKLVCDPHRLPQARSWIRLHPAGFVVAYPPRRVNSLYLDTLHLSSLNDSLAGLNVRQKLRLRWYGDGSDIQPVLELKLKQNLLGMKKRILLQCKLDLTLPWVDIMGIIHAETRFLPPHLFSILQTVNHPTLLNHYQREYYVTPDDAIRVTLDFAQVAYDQRLAPRPNLHIRLPIADTVVIEIKAAQEQAERLSEVVAQFPVGRSRNSKYVNGLRLGWG
ncbi:MAG: polyphosphate polymerase domain-containing protein [Chloroflexota bacterium]|nr:polyphosphate polymerase domain-containing protein [Chloroflexota bacterium]